jgi:hypothetical protein
MLFNIDKYKIMHIGYNNKKVNYEMNGINLNEVAEEPDLDVIIQLDLKWNKQCVKAVNAANGALGMTRSFCSLVKTWWYSYTRVWLDHI